MMFTFFHFYPGSVKGDRINSVPWSVCSVSPLPQSPGLLVAYHYLGATPDIFPQFVHLFVFYGDTALRPIVRLVYTAFLVSGPTDAVDADVAAQSGCLGRQAVPLVRQDYLFEFGGGDDLITVPAPGVKRVRII